MLEVLILDSDVMEGSQGPQASLLPHHAYCPCLPPQQPTSRLLVLLHLHLKAERGRVGAGGHAQDGVQLRVRLIVVKHGGGLVRLDCCRPVLLEFDHPEGQSPYGDLGGQDGQCNMHMRFPHLKIWRGDNGSSRMPGQGLGGNVDPRSG